MPKPYFSSREITLYNAKYEEILPLLKPGTIDLLLTDPPFANTNLAWDKQLDWTFYWTEAHRLSKPKAPMIHFASGKFVNQLINTNLKHFRYELIWEKRRAAGFLSANQRPLRAHENILFFSQLYKGSTYNPQKVEGKTHTNTGKSKRPKHYAGKPLTGVPAVTTNLYHPRSVLYFNHQGKSLHPTQKPLDLMEWLVRTYSNRNDVILEPFAGSGSTIIAALLNSRKCIAIEQSEEYCEIIAKRIREEN